MGGPAFRGFGYLGLQILLRFSLYLFVLQHPFQLFRQCEWFSNGWSSLSWSRFSLFCIPLSLSLSHRCLHPLDISSSLPNIVMEPHLSNMMAGLQRAYILHASLEPNMMHNASQNDHTGRYLKGESAKQHLFAGVYSSRNS